jgi:hypothetical protein
VLREPSRALNEVCPSEGGLFRAVPRCPEAQQRQAGETALQELSSLHDNLLRVGLFRGLYQSLRPTQQNAAVIRREIVKTAVDGQAGRFFEPFGSAERGDNGVMPPCSCSQTMLRKTLIGSRIPRFFTSGQISHLG